MLENNEVMEIIDILKQNTFYGMEHSKSANDQIFSDSENKVLKAIAELNLATHYFAVAKSIYFSNYSELGRHEIDEVFRKFDVYVEEITRNICTNHSHQWSDIEFQALASTYEFSPLWINKSTNFSSQ